MVEPIFNQIFTDKALVQKIKHKIPQLFLMAEVDNSRNGKLGMEVGSARERILIAMLMHKFGAKNVDPNIPITEAEVDVYVHNEPLSIKTISGAKIGGVKLIWTVDAQKALEFSRNYRPECDMMLTHIRWGGTGYLYVFSKVSQRRILDELGPEKYMKLPKPGTNPRGVELSALAIEHLIAAPDTKSISIDFIRENMVMDAYKRWLDLWQAN